MKKRYILLIIFIALAVAVWFYACTGVVCAPTIEDRPDSSTSSLAPDALPAQKEGVITVSTPLPETKVSLPVIIKGKAVGNWFFEASAPVDIVNWDGLIIGQGYVTVDEGYDWMTTDMVPFTGSVSYDASKLGAYKYGWIIMKKDNPSGEAKFDDSLEFKVLFP